MDIDREETIRRMGYGEVDTYTAIGIVHDGKRIETAIVSPARGEWKVVRHFHCDPDGRYSNGSTVDDCNDLDHALHAFNLAFRDALVGKRVKLVNDVDRFQTCLVLKGATGTVASVCDMDRYTIAVKLDEHVPDLDEWDNELHWSEEGCADADGREWASVEAFLADVEFIDGEISPVGQANATV